MQVKAVCVLQNQKEQVYGVVNFIQDVELRETGTRVYGTIKGLPVGLHGFHIHTYGDLSNGCDSAGPHFNPTHQDHGSLTSAVRHVGDFGNLESRSPLQDVNFDFFVKDLNLVGPHSIIGRAVIIHADADDLGRTSHPLSKTTGNAGARLVCGVIGIAASKTM
jgi:Cu-Zn family superoxide dismutase